MEPSNLSNPSNVVFEDYAYVIGKFSMFKRKRYFTITPPFLACLSKPHSTELWRIDLSQAILTGLEPAFILIEVPDIAYFRIECMSPTHQQRFLDALQNAALYNFNSIYEIGAHLGTGIYGETFRAVHRKTQKSVVVKKILKHPMAPAPIKRSNSDSNVLISSLSRKLSSKQNTLTSQLKRGVSLPNARHESNSDLDQGETQFRKSRDWDSSNKKLQNRVSTDPRSNQNPVNNNIPINNNNPVNNNIPGRGIGFQHLHKSTSSLTKQSNLLEEKEHEVMRKHERNVDGLWIWDADLIERELEIIRETKHYNLIELYDFVVEPSTIYFVYESLPDNASVTFVLATLGIQQFRNLSFRLPHSSESSDGVSGSVVDVSEALISSWFKQLFEVLDFIHDQGLVHGFLCPSNVLIGESNRLVLCELNIAHLLDLVDVAFPENSRKQNHFKYFTLNEPEFSAPECFHMQSRNRMTYAADMWAAGVLLQKLLTGSVPYSGRSHAEVVGKVLSKQKVFARFELISPQARSLIKALLAPNPGSRISAHDALNHEWIQNGNLFSTRPICREAISACALERAAPGATLRNSKNNSLILRHQDRVKPGVAGNLYATKDGQSLFTGQRAASHLASEGASSASERPAFGGSLAHEEHPRAAKGVTIHRTPAAHEQINSNRTKQFYSGKVSGSSAKSGAIHANGYNSVRYGGQQSKSKQGLGPQESAREGLHRAQSPKSKGKADLRSSRLKSSKSKSGYLGKQSTFESSRSSRGVKPFQPFGSFNSFKDSTQTTAESAREKTEKPTLRSSRAMRSTTALFQGRTKLFKRPSGQESSTENV